jgi:hypothetical protein
MNKVTKILIATIGLGGLGFFLYKKGLFSNLKPALPTQPIQPIQPTQPSVEEEVILEETIIGTPVQVKVEDPIYNDSYYQAIVYPTNNDTYGGLKKPNDYMVNVMQQEDFWSQGYSNSYNLDFSDYKLGIDENYRYK